MTRTVRSLLFLATLSAMAVAVPGLAQTTGQKDALKAATDRMNAIKAATGAKPTPAQAPLGDPCTAVTLAAVQIAFPTVKSGENTKRLERDFGISECQWKTGTGNVMLVLQEAYNPGKNAREDTEGMAELVEGEAGMKNVRIETFPSIGVDNAAYAEARDPARGVKSDAVHLALRKGKHSLTIGGPDMAGRDRAQVLKGLEAMGKQAASRF